LDSWTWAAEEIGPSFTLPKLTALRESRIWGVVWCSMMTGPPA
jgi:hypothetical protein